MSRGLLEEVTSKTDFPRVTRFSVPFLILLRVIKYQKIFEISILILPMGKPRAREAERLRRSLRPAGA